MNEENQAIGFTGKNVIMFALSTIASLLFVYLIVFAISRGWKKGQNNG